MIRYHAAWLLPIAAPPIRRGWVEVEDGRIVALGDDDAAARSGGVTDHDLGSVVVLPGLVNAHTHLELSYLRGRVPPGDEFVAWIRRVVAARRERPDPRSTEIMRGIDEGIEEAVRSGTALVGDISNTLATFDPLRRSALGGVVFYELIRFKASDAERVAADALDALDALEADARVRVSLAAHAPYSVAPQLFGAIGETLARRPSSRSSVHLSESVEEVRFIETGEGAWRVFLEEIGAWDAAWTAPAVTPVRYLSDLGFLGARVLAVHGVQMTSADLAQLVAGDVTLVTCPRSNTHTGAGVPPIAAFYASGVRVAVGTDSLASVEDLNLFAELAVMRTLAPAVPASRLLDSATRQGALALGFGGEYGTIEPGKRARLLAVSIPAAIDDVEEYLVRGVAPDRIRWVDG